jgi:ubiquinone/menaquinone biosynthesis C-methylase UbiE
MAPASTQTEIDRANEAFWDELCGSKFARENGVTDSSPESIARFDSAYLDFYPYLTSYIPDDVAGKRVLEIGLGYGTMGQQIAERGADYNGLDIALGPVAMMRERLRRVGLDDAEGRVTQGSALEIPHPDESFDHVISIGCLHVTGDFAAAIRDVHRVIKPGGTAVVMVYYKHAFRRYSLMAAKLPYLFREGPSAVEREVRRVYDQTLEGEAAPVIEYPGRIETRRIFRDAGFHDVHIKGENFDNIKFLKREWFLGNLARPLGIDIYITATK